MSSLRVKPEWVSQLLNVPAFQETETEELLDRARMRLGLARYGAIRGIRVHDRAMAIAILMGVPDRTEYAVHRRSVEADQ